MFHVTIIKFKSRVGDGNLVGMAGGEIIREQTTYSDGRIWVRGIGYI